MQAIKKEVDTAVEEAKTGPLPKDEMLWKNIYRWACACGCCSPNAGLQFRRLDWCSVCRNGLGSHTRGRDSQTKIQL